MNANSDRILQRLGTGKLIGIDHGEGSRVNCVEGSLWITQSNDPRDITHNLRTAVIGPDGKLVKIYTGNEWTPDEIIADLKPTANAD